MTTILNCSILKTKHTNMAIIQLGPRFIERDGRNFLVLMGKEYPSRTMHPNETLRDSEAFKKKMKKVREDFLRRQALSWIALRDKVLD